MTTATAATATVPTLADLVLVRMALPSNTPKRVRDDVGKLFEQGFREDTFDEVRNELAAAGHLTKGKRNTFAVTDAGRAEVLHILDVPELPPKTNWANVVAKYLLPRATGLSAEAAARLKTADGLAAFYLAGKYDLGRRAGGSVDKVLEAVACRELGFPEETTLAGLLEAVLNKLIGSDRRLTRKELKAQLPLFETGFSGPKLKADEIRQRLVRDWLADRPRDEDPRQVEAFDLPAFAATVLALARVSPPAERFHDNKAFIAPLWRAGQREPNFPRLSLDEFKQRLLEANAAGLLHLSRADLVQAMDPRLVAESETAYLNATFHFVLLEGGAA